ncbi:MAG TPA: adenylate/guanylate cyclase domain-containing protein [Chroococcales cyanobacterium]
MDIALNRFSISKKVVGFIAILLAMMLGISVYSFFKTKRVKDEIVDLNEWIIPLVNSIEAIDSNALEQEVHLERLLRLYEIKSRDQAKIKEELEFFNNNEIKIEREATRGRKLLTQAVQRMKLKDDIVVVARFEPLLENIEGQHQHYHNQVLKLVETLDKNEFKTARILEIQVATEEDRLNKMLSDMFAQLSQFSEKQAHLVKQHEIDVFWLSSENLIISFLAFLLGVIVTTILTNRIVRPVHQIIHSAEDIAHGNLDVVVPVSSKDEIGMLARSFNAMAQELKAKERIKATFGKYVDPRVVDTLIKQEDSGLNNGEKRVMTVFFSDLEGFSTIGELLTPLGLVNLINQYLTLASEPIIRHKGVIDKYIGDAVMSFWGPPFTDESEHARLACMASLEQFTKLNELHEIMPDLLGFRKGLPKINIRVGLCTGELVVGNIGSNISKSYTVIGDTVNIAARLESANKQYGTQILMSEDTYKLVKNDFETREIDNIIVVGKSQPVRVFELLGFKGKVEKPVLELRNYFEKGLAAYRMQDWDEAQRDFDTCLEINSSDKPSQVFVERIKVLRDNPPPDSWDGVWQMTKK